MESPNTKIEFLNEIKNYLLEQGAGIRIIDTIDEVREMLSYGISEEQEQKEWKRIKEILDFYSEKESTQTQVSINNVKEKTEFTNSIKVELEKCHVECCSLAERKVEAQTPVIGLIQEEFRQISLVEMNQKIMETRQNFVELFRNGVKNCNLRIRETLVEYVNDIVLEYERTLEKIRTSFKKTEVLSIHTSDEEIYKEVLLDYNGVQAIVKAKAENFQIDEKEFMDFAQKSGEKLEKIADREKKITLFIYLIPAIMYIIKKIVDLYLLKQESNISDFGNLLSKTIIILIFFIIILFVGLLYYFYIKIVKKIRDKSTVRKIQAYIQPRIEQFLCGLNMKEKIKDILLKHEEEIGKIYINHHKPLFDKLTYNVDSIKIQETQVQSLIRKYNEIIMIQK